jgi:hypothetical protein
MNRLARIAIVGVGTLLVLGLPLAAHAQSVNITYYTINPNDPDADHLQGGVFNNEVQNSLGPNGLPVLNIPAFGCTSDCYTQAGAPGFPLPAGTGPNVNVLSTTGEITYWDPALNPYVTETLSTTTSLPFDRPSNFFPPNGTGTSDGPPNGYQAAVLSGTLFAPTTEQLSFMIGSDDMSFAYIDGQVVCDDGGVHASSSVPCSTPIIDAGDHSFDLFFVDINQVQAGLTFSITTQGVTINSTPEPASLVLFGSAIAGLPVIQRWRRRKHAARSGTAA